MIRVRVKRILTRMFEPSASSPSGTSIALRIRIRINCRTLWWVLTCFYVMLIIGSSYVSTIESVKRAGGIDDVEGTQERVGHRGDAPVVH